MIIYDENNQLVILV